MKWDWPCEHAQRQWPGQDAVFWGIIEGELLVRSLERLWLTLSKYMKSCHSWEVRVTPWGPNKQQEQLGVTRRQDSLALSTRTGWRWTGSPQEIVTPLPLCPRAHSIKGHMSLGWIGLEEHGRNSSQGFDLGTSEKMTAGPWTWHHSSDYSSLHKARWKYSVNILPSLRCFLEWGNHYGPFPSPILCTQLFGEYECTF